MTSKIPNIIRTMCKQHGYRKVRSDIPYSFKLVRKEGKNPTLYCTLSGELFLPYWMK